MQSDEQPRLIRRGSRPLKRQYNQNNEGRARRQIRPEKEHKLTTVHAFNLENGVCRTFTTVSALKSWLDDKRWESGSPEAFTEWLENYFDSGNEISVHGEHYDYMDCLELI